MRHFSDYTYLRRRSRGQFVTAMLSMALVLFFLGIFASIALFTDTFARMARESILMKVFIYDGVGTEQLQNFIEELGAAPYVQDYQYVTKQEASRIFLDRTGEEVLEAMDGVNPLLASVNLRLREAYLQPDSLRRIREELTGHSLVAEVYYPDEMLAAISRNAGVLTLVFMIVGVVVILVAFYLIFSTIKLSIYAQRLSIRTMQLIGATSAFIRRPFLLRGLGQGALAGMLAVALLMGLVYFLNWRLDIIDLERSAFFTSYFIGILGGIVLFGSALGLAGSYFAVNRYLGRNLDDLMA